jgi:hypothetical protein
MATAGVIAFPATSRAAEPKQKVLVPTVHKVCSAADAEVGERVTFTVTVTAPSVFPDGFVYAMELTDSSDSPLVPVSDSFRLHLPDGIERDLDVDIAVTASGWTYFINDLRTLCAEGESFAVSYECETERPGSYTNAAWATFPGRDGGRELTKVAEATVDYVWPEAEMPRTRKASDGLVGVIKKTGDTDDLTPVFAGLAAAAAGVTGAVFGSRRGKGSDGQEIHE